MANLLRNRKGVGIEVKGKSGEKGENMNVPDLLISSSLDTNFL